MHRDSSDTLDKGDGRHNDKEPDDKLDNQGDRAAAGCRADFCTDLTDESERQTGDDTDHDDQGNTVSDASVSDPLAKPHDEHRAGHKYDGGDEVVHEPAPAELGFRKERGTRDLAMDRSDVGRSLDAENEDGEVSGKLIHLPTAAFALHLEFPEVRDEHAQKLNHD